jgi:hypothetical protein
MRLSTLYAQLGAAEKQALAEKAGVHADYLWQIAKRWNGKRASIDLIERLAKADRRLTRSDMLAEFTEPAPASAAD